MKVLQEKIVIQETNGISFTREELPELVALAESFKKLVNSPTPYGEGEAFPASLVRFADEIISSLKGGDKVCPKEEDVLKWKTIPGLGMYQISNVGGFIYFSYTLGEDGPIQFHSGLIRNIHPFEAKRTLVSWQKLSEEEVKHYWKARGNVDERYLNEEDKLCRKK